MPESNILLVILDSVRARNCSLYGHENETTPFLSQLAEDGIWFKQARAPGIHSVASHASIWTGQYVEEHQITEHTDFLKPEATVWHHLTTKYGYETGIFTPNVIVAGTSNLADVFGTCVGPKRTKFRLFDGGLAPLDIQGNISTLEYIREAMAHGAPARSLLNGVYKRFTSRDGAHNPTSESASVYIREFLDWLDECTEPWAACINLMDAHTPFVPDPEYDLWSDETARTAREREVSGETPRPFTDAHWNHLAALEPSYDGTIRQTDAAVEHLVDSLRDRGVLDDTLLVVTSDHGEGFGERSAVDTDVRLRHHSWGVNEVLTHVPLIVRPPGGGTGRQIREPATLARFRTAVEATLNNEDPIVGFVPEDDVVSSTYRIKPPGDELNLPQADREPYFGPWRAIYRALDGDVVKYVRRGADAVTLNVPDAQTTSRRADGDDGVVEEVFSSFTDAGVKLGAANERHIDEEVENRLEELGYLR